MLYTLGLNYPENVNLLKAVGGSVFHSYEDAENRRNIQEYPEHWKIWGVEAEWEDCEIIEGQNFRSLKYASKILKISNT